MTKDDIFQLYKKVQNKDRAAEDRLIAEHAIKHPRSNINKIKRGTDPDYRTWLHVMYLHLTRGRK